MTELRHCSHCGQILPTRRLGVRMTPLKARIFDIVQRGGQDGVPREELRAIVGLTMASIKAHIHQINESIEDEGWKIVGRGNARLVNTRAHRKVMQCLGQSLA